MCASSTEAPESTSIAAKSASSDIYPPPVTKGEPRRSVTAKRSIGLKGTRLQLNFQDFGASQDQFLSLISSLGLGGKFFHKQTFESVPTITTLQDLAIYSDYAITDFHKKSIEYFLWQRVLRYESY